MHHVLITTTFMNPNTEATSVSTALLPCASYDEAELVTRNVWDQRNGGNAAPNGVAHDAIILGSQCTVATARDTELEGLRSQVAVLEAARPHWAQGYTSDGVAAQTATAALSSLWGLLGASNQTEAMSKLRATVAAMQQFCDRVEKGEVRSVSTYGTFKDLLGAPVPPGTITDLPDGTVHIQAGDPEVELRKRVRTAALAYGHELGAHAVAEVIAAVRNVAAQAPERRVWQMPEGASLIFCIKSLHELVDGIRVTVTREPTVGKWYAGVDNSQPLPLYGATARYEGEGRWYLGTGNRIDLFQYDYLQELV